MTDSHWTRAAFTLIELLVVIAIIAILAVVVVLTLNPAQLLAQSRDSNRVSDMTTLNNALGLYATDQSGASTFSLGSSSVVYVSLPDPAATTTAGTNCGTMGLPALPLGWNYHCAASSTYRQVNGTGWMPVNLTNITSGSPISTLPVDPTNQSSSRLYYTYTTNGGQFEVTAAMESSKYKLGGSNDVISSDGSTLATVYAKGTNLAIEPLDYGDSSLLGLWTFDEGSGTVAYDYSGSNATGSWQGTLGSQWSANAKVGPYAGNFDGTDNYVSAPALNIFNEHAFTVTGWIYPTVSKEDEGLLGVCQASTLDHCLHLAIRSSTPYMGFFGDDISGGTTTLDTWYYLAFTYTGGAGGLRTIYLNGIAVASGTSAAGLQVTNGTVTDIGTDVIEGDVQGMIDDVRIYNRALSTAEIAAMYNGGK